MYIQFSIAVMGKLVSETNLLKVKTPHYCVCSGHYLYEMDSSPDLTMLHFVHFCPVNPVETKINFFKVQIFWEGHEIWEGNKILKKSFNFTKYFLKKLEDFFKFFLSSQNISTLSAHSDVKNSSTWNQTGLKM